MVKICPISLRKTNENLSRLNASFTVLMSTLFLFTESPVFILVILMDFMLRNILEGKLNPVSRINQYIIEVIHISSHMINAGPKIFAARVGLILSFLSTVFFLLANTFMSSMIIAILLLFAFLESALNYCIACKLYPYFLPLNKLVENSDKKG